ncbi:MAG: hypothetical protein AAGF95_25015 [Chloroflexota bacterium]
MPIVTIKLVTRDEAEYSDKQQVQALADELGDLFGSGTGGTWVKVEFISMDMYAENRTEIAPSVQPTFVEVLKSELPSLDERKVEALQIAQVVAAGLHRPPENVHVLYLPPAKGRMAFGGKLLDT